MTDQTTSKGVAPHGEPKMQGWLFKWTNYLKGYQRRWFVLQKGELSYYRNQAEMAHTCRGTISLQRALIHTVDSCTFVISNGETRTFHIKASTEVDMQSWVTALELAKTQATSCESEEDEEEPADDTDSVEELPQVIKQLTVKLDDIKACAEMVERHKLALQRKLSEVENLQDVDKTFSEKATVFRVACNALILSFTEYVDLTTTHGNKWKRMLHNEREQRERLQEMLEQLARQLSQLEKVAGTSGPVGSPSDDEEENEFYDCDTEGACNSKIASMTLSHHRNSSDSSENENGTNRHSNQTANASSTSAETSGNEAVSQQQRKITEVKSEAEAGQTVRQRRTNVPEKPNYPLNLWSIMKNCIGKDLSKIPMPVNFSEPLSMLQRLTEDYEYANILDQAAKCTDPCEQLAYVAAFTVSSYSTTSNRTGKPFNPLLGETYECDRTDDLGWRAISEQVSHHPPMVAQYCEGKSWKCWQEFTMTSKFRGKYLQVIPRGTAHVEFMPSGNRYSWRKVTTTVHNIIVGKLWVDHHGEMEIIGHGGEAAGLTCHLKYIPYSYFTRDNQRRVTGWVVGADKFVKWMLRGTWDHKVDIVEVTGSLPATEAANICKDEMFSEGSGAKEAWRRQLPPEDCEKFYGFTILAAQLNQMEDDVAPTDSRRRPDQRLMEEGFWEEANQEKLRLEEKQRASRRQREEDARSSLSVGKPQYEPVWFTREKEGDSDVVSHRFRGDYWDCKEAKDWERCPDIF